MSATFVTLYVCRLKLTHSQNVDQTKKQRVMMTSSYPHSHQAMETRTDITVVIPVYNGAAFIEESIRSVLRQDMRPTKILVVDDGSTDSTCDIVRNLFSDEPLVELVISGSNNGPSHVRNLAMHLARDPYVAFLDADDAWQDNHLSGFHEASCKYPNADVIFTDSELLGSADHRMQNDNTRIEQVIAPLVQLLERNIIPQSGVMLRREVALDAGGYDAKKRYAEDYDLWLRLSLRPQICMVHISRATCLRREHQGQVSGNNADKMLKSAWNVRRLVVSELERSPPEVHSALLAAMNADLRTTWNMRNRALINEVLSHTSWIPGAHNAAATWYARVGYQWPLWRLAAALYDNIPNAWKTKIRSSPRK